MPNRRSPRTLTCPSRLSLSIAFAVTMAVAATACTSEPTPGVDAGDYRQALSALCTGSTQERAALAPPDDAGVSTFAAAVADILTRQADAARALRPPGDLDADHRAFVQNTADQAARWTSLASTATDDTEQFGAIQTAILELTLGRDDLATEMELPACRVQPG